MFNQRLVTSLLQLFVILLGVGRNFAQDNSITFIPDVPLCIGEELQMICFVVPPDGTSFVAATAMISLDGSTTFSVVQFNALTSLGGVDTSRYTADTTGLSISTSRPGVRITISDYQATDESVVFGCAGSYPNGSYSDVLISGSPQALANPPSSPLVTLSQTDIFCFNVLMWSTPSSDRSITSYSVYRDGVSIYNGSNIINQFIDYTLLNINAVYEYSVVAISCAGNSTAGVNSTRIRNNSITFIPDVPLCIGEEVQMICFIVHPADTSFIIGSASVSLNESTPFRLDAFNAVTSVGGVDTTRYTGDVIGLRNTTCRPGVRITISDYQATDESVVFGCGGLFLNGSVSNVLISGSPQALADPPSSPLVTLSQTDTICSNVLMWSTPSSDRSIISYSISRDGISIADVPHTTTEYTDSDIININTVYEYSVVAISCAGNSTAGVNSTRIGDNSITFIPDVPLCIGEELQIICFIVPPEGSSFAIGSASVSLNESTPFRLDEFNDVTSVGGVNTSRYTADVIGLSNTTCRPGVRITISDYQATDESVVFGCGGLFPNASVSDVLISDSPQSLADPPSSPLVTLSQTDTICSNVLMWSTPSSDRSITSYSISRGGDSITNVPHTTTEYTDSDRIGINTVYTYSVVAISCAGTSTSIDVNSTLIGGTSLATDSLIISYDDTANELFVDWTLNQPTQPITVTYNLSLEYSYTQFNDTDYFNETEIFSQISTDTDYLLSLTDSIFLSNDSVTFNITATLRITHQCDNPYYDGIVLTANTESTIIPTEEGLSIVAIIGICVGVSCLCCGPVLILTGVTILVIFCFVSKKKEKIYPIFNPKKKSDTHELGPVEEQMYSQINKENKPSKEQPVVVEEKMEGLYADIEHELPNPDTLKRPESVDETLCLEVQPSVDGPSL